uniref:Integrase catalytic domain-containing protein n=1 Tax=Tanacetum cinerariifolium TaxID=118510 RepID=A0A6L2L4X5_TANCI|nr:hypothetical protein [Tanacetum cinerariifolium]
MKTQVGDQGACEVFGYLLGNVMEGCYNWKLLESYGVHIITFITTQMIMLVERKYPLTKFILEQMLNNVRLEVEEESEMSLELLRLTASDHYYCHYKVSVVQIVNAASIAVNTVCSKRLGHVNFKTMNKLVKGNLVRGLPSKIINNDHSCVACQKGKQHNATLTDDFIRFSWMFFLTTKDETSKVLKQFITTIESQINRKVKVIRCDNGTKFKNRDLDEFCRMRGIKREYSNAKTLQQNRVAERKNRTLIEVARTMLADSLLPITFWTEAVNTACFVLNRVFMRPFGCPVTILNTLDPLGKFKGKADEGFFVGYSVTSKVAVGNQTDKNVGPQDTNSNAGTQDNIDTGKEVSDQHYIMLPLWSSLSSTYKSSDDKPADDKPNVDIGSKTVEEPVNKDDQAYRDELDRLMSQEKEAREAADALRKEFKQGCMDQRGVTKAGSTNSFNTVSNPVNATSTSGTFSAGRPSSPHLDAVIPANTLLHVDQVDSQIPDLEDTAELQSTSIFNSAYDDDLDKFDSPVKSVGARADINNMESSTIVSPIPKHKVHIDHPKDQILRDLKSAVQTSGMAKKNSRAHALMEPKKVFQALDDESWVEAMQEELLNKKDERGIVVRNKARLVAQGHRQEEGINHDDIFAHVARIEAIRIFLAFASFMGFIVYQMDVKSAFLYGTIEEEVYDSQPLGFINPQFPNKVYKIEKALYGLHQAPRARYLKGKPKLGLWYPKILLLTWKPVRIVIMLEQILTGNPQQEMKLCTASTIVNAAELEENVEFHQIVDFLSTSHFNSVKQIHAIADGKAVVISESSVRSDLLFNDEDEKDTPLFNSMLVQNQAPEGKGSTLPTEPQHTPSTSQPNISATQTAPLQTATYPTVFHEPQTKTHIEQILPSPSTYQRKHRKTHKPRKAKKVIELPQTSVPLDIRADEAVHQEGVTEIGSGDRTRRQETTLVGANARTRVLALKQFKTAQDLVIKRLQKKVKILEKKQRARTPGMKLFKIGNYKKKTLDKENDVNAAELVSTAGDAVNVASVIPDVSAIGPSTSTAKDIFKDEMTNMADTLMAIRRTRPRTTLIVIHDVKEEPRRATPPPIVQSQDKEVNDGEQQAERSKKRSRVDHDKESVKKQKLKEDDAKKMNLELV